MALKTVIDGSNKVSARQLKDLFRQVDEQLISGEMLQSFLEKKNPFQRKWKTWKTVTIGAFEGAWEIPEKLKQQGFTCGGVEDTLKTIYLGNSHNYRNMYPKKVELVKVCLEELGFTEISEEGQGMIPIDEVLSAALKMGLALCLPEDAVALREQYVDQENMDFIYIGMVPIASFCDNGAMFAGMTSFCLNGKNIHGCSHSCGHSPSNIFIFRRVT